MAEDLSDLEPGAEEPAEAGPAQAALDPAAAALAMDAARTDPALAAAATRYFQRQARLVDVQTEHLHEQREVTLSQLKLKRLGERLKVGLQLFVVLVAIAAAIGLAEMIWSATQDRSLVVEAFSVPPDLAARGATGQAMAAELLDRLGDINAGSSSSRAASSYAGNWGEEAKVEIPETGVSIGELQRSLRGWLGHETHITGEVMHTPAGLALTVRAGESAGRTLIGTEADLPGLIQRAAEAAFQSTQPYRFTAYLFNTGRPDQALEAARALARNGPVSERAWAWTQISNLLGAKGDGAGAVQAGEAATRIDPRLGLAYINESTGWLLLGRDQKSFDVLREGVARLRVQSGAQVDPLSRAWLTTSNQAQLDVVAGDDQGAARGVAELQKGQDFEGFGALLATVRAYDLALDHDVSGSLQAFNERPMSDEDAVGQTNNWGDAAVSQYERAVALDDWGTAADDMNRTIAAAPKWPDVARFAVPHMLKPRLAVALAMSGRLAEAEAVAATLPAGCYRCLSAQGWVATAAHDWARADRAFAAAVAQAPRLPQAYAAWGASRLARGDPDGAIAMLKTANATGPRFADPLELWGEALMRKGEVAGAVDRFRRADLYAPRWGRNHLRWGEALLRGGDSAKAKAQFQIAAGLDLSAADRAALNVYLKKTSAAA